MDALTETLRATADRLPDVPALRAQGTTVTWSQLADAVEACARGLQALGVERGDRVALILPNCPQFPITYFGTVRIGAIAVPVNPVLTVPEAAHIVADSGAAVIVAVSATAPLAQAVARQCPDVRHVIVSGDQRPGDTLDFAALLASAPAKLPDPGADDDVAALVYTSGTTGSPKGAMLTHTNLLANARSCVEAIDFSSADILLTALPLSHSFGATVCMIIPVLVGCTSVYLPRFEALSALETIEAERVTVFPGVPSMFAWLTALKTERRFDTSSLRLCVSGGAALPIEIVAPFEERYGTVLVEGYGPTEASPVVSCNRSKETRKLGTVGPPLPGVEVTIQDDAGHVLPPGEIGEVCVRGANVMKGYWNDPAATAEVMRGDWLLTGDLGTLDEDGYLSIVDRKKDLIIVGGLNVYPREVEDVLRQLPEVRDAAVIGVKSPLQGERVHAFVELHEGQTLELDRALAHCHRHLARFKVPRAIEVVEALPRSATGKVLRRKLRERFQGDQS